MSELVLLAAASGAVDASKMKITIPQALELSGIGTAIIFAVLVLLMGIIYLMAFIIRKADASSFSLKDKLSGLFKKKGATVEPVAVSAVETKATAELAPGSAGNVALNDVPNATAAMLMAIVADELKTPVNELKFISIKEVKE